MEQVEKTLPEPKEDLQGLLKEKGSAEEIS